MVLIYVCSRKGVPNMDRSEFKKKYAGADVRSVNGMYCIATASQWAEWIVVRRGKKGFDMLNPIATAPTAKKATEIARADYQKTVTVPTKERRLEEMAEELRRNGYEVKKIGE